MFAFIDSEVKANRVKHQEAGWTIFKQVKDTPAEPSILIGFNALKKKGPFDHLIGGLQPIYLTRTGEKTGPWLGNVATEPIVLKARPGYIVGAMHIKTASTFDAFSVTFVRLERGRIVASDNYTSEWIGGSSGKTSTVGGSGALIIGFSGHIHPTGDINAIGALSVGPPPAEPQNPPPAVPAHNVPGSVFTFIEAEVKANRIQVADKGLGKSTRDIPPEGGILIGFNAAAGDGPFGPQVVGLQPIYLMRSGEKAGQWFGHASAKPTVLRAKPGYVVGALNLRTGAVFDAFSVTFVRFEKGRMVVKDNYASDWVGGTGGNPGFAGGPGSLIVGVVGRTGAGGNVSTIGSVSVRLKE